MVLEVLEVQGDLYQLVPEVLEVQEVPRVQGSLEVPRVQEGLELRQFLDFLEVQEVQGNLYQLAREVQEDLLYRMDLEVPEVLEIL